LISVDRGAAARKRPEIGFGRRENLRTPHLWIVLFR
jgi:hypothetical protein